MPDSLNDLTPRRGFLASVATAAAGIGLSGSIVSCAPAEAPPAAKASVAADPALEAWFAKIEGLPITGIGVAELITGGVLVGACDVALTVYSSAAAEKMKMKPEDVKKEWIANLLPGVQVVPSGVMAVGRTQELGCTYCFAG